MYDPVKEAASSSNPNQLPITSILTAAAFRQRQPVKVLKGTSTAYDTDNEDHKGKETETVSSAAFRQRYGKRKFQKAFLEQSGSFVGALQPSQSRSGSSLGTRDGGMGGR